MSVKSPSKNKLSAKQRLRLSFIFAGIMCAGLLVFSIFTPEFKRGAQGSKNTEVTPTLSPSPTPSPKPTSTPTPTPTNTPTPTPVIPLVKNEEAEIENLVKKYFDAKLSDDKSKFEGLVTNFDILDFDYIQKQYQYVISLDNFQNYVVKGVEGSELEYVLFVCHDLHIVTIDNTPVPELTRLIVVKSEPDENGETHLLIDTNPTSEAQSAYITDIMSHDDVTQLYLDVQQRLFEASEKDEKLKDILNKLYPSQTP